VQRLSPLLTTMIILVSLLAHHIHAPVATAGVLAGTAIDEHMHHGVQELQVIDHGMLDEIQPELCTIGDTVPPAPTGQQGQIPALAPDAGAAAFHREAPSATSWEAPVFPPDVLRAYLQVFLN
jgi:hypothetical protein